MSHDWVHLRVLLAFFFPLFSRFMMGWGLSRFPWLCLAFDFRIIRAHLEPSNIKIPEVMRHG